MVVRPDFVVTSPFAHIKIPDDVDSWSYITRNFHNYPQRKAMIDGDTGETLTFQQVEEVSETIAAHLLDHGYRTETALTIVMSNCLEYVLVALAVWRLGGTVACVNAMLLPGEVKKTIKMLQAEFLVCDATTVECALKAMQGTSVKKIFCKSAHPRCLPLVPQSRVDLSRLPRRLHINQHKDTALIMFSSGTTGLPKGVLTSHRSLVSTCRLFGGPEIDKLSKEHGVVYQPLSHVYGIGLVITHLYWGITDIIMPKFDFEQFIKLIAQYKVDQVHVVPPIMVMLASSTVPRRYDLSCVRGISCGAAPLSVEVEEQVARVLGPQCRIRQLFGMTEVCLSTCHNTPRADQADPPGLTYYRGSVGYPVPANLHKVVDINTGRNLGPHKEGEICIKSDYLMLGYLNNPTETERTIDAEGWLHTGDIGYYNDDGCFFVIDRLKELIKYKAYQVAPAELESVLLSHEYITDVGVVGLADPEAGELPHAWVVRKQGSSLSAQQIQQFVNDNVAPFKRLRGGIRFVDAIPKSASGKILRRQIRATQAPTNSKL